MRKILIILFYNFVFVFSNFTNLKGQTAFIVDSTFCNKIVQCEFLQDYSEKLKIGIPNTHFYLCRVNSDTLLIVSKDTNNINVSIYEKIKIGSTYKLSLVFLEDPYLIQNDLTNYKFSFNKSDLTVYENIPNGFLSSVGGQFEKKYISFSVVFLTDSLKFFKNNTFLENKYLNEYLKKFNETQNSMFLFYYSTQIIGEYILKESERNDN